MVSIRAACLIVPAILGATGLVQAGPEPVSQADLARYEKGFGSLQQNTRTFSADILQTLALQGLSQPIVSKGVLDYAAPDRLLIRFSQPAGEWMLVNGAMAAVKKQGKPPDYHDLSGQGGKGSHAANLLDFFRNGPDRWHRDFDVSMTREGDRLWVRLKPWMTPTSTFQGVDSIVTTLQLPSYEIVSMDIVMNGANAIRYEFSGARRNIPMPPALFAMPRDSSP
jgi:hypothetical protein